MQERFAQACFAHTTTRASEYLPLFMHYWNMQEYSDSYLLCADFPPFCIFQTQNQTLHGTESNFAIFLIAQWNCIFQGASLELTKNLATLIPEKIQVFTKPSYTIVLSLFLVTPYAFERECWFRWPCHEQFHIQGSYVPSHTSRRCDLKASSPNGISLWTMKKYRSVFGINVIRWKLWLDCGAQCLSPSAKRTCRSLCWKNTQCTSRIAK